MPLLLGDPTKAETVLGWKPKYDFKLLAKAMYSADLRLVMKQASADGKNIPIEAYSSPKQNN